MVDFDASKPEDGEVRRKAVGVIEGRLFALVYAERDGVIRIISARRCNAAEARRYGPVHS
ncbi:BrnT family toxin [Phenylobacterium sp.]|uniref:BrnT family toxin n=1 Tax=Phenylobacterium sp. TaxID=1871053 RepID=UPI003525FDA0